MIHGNLSTAGQEKDLKVGRITVLGRGGILCNLTVWYMAPSRQGQEGASCLVCTPGSLMLWAGLC